MKGQSGLPKTKLMTFISTQHFNAYENIDFISKYND